MDYDIHSDVKYRGLEVVEAGALHAQPSSSGTEFVELIRTRADAALGFTAAEPKKAQK